MSYRQIGLRLTPTLLRLFLERGITFKKGRTQGSIFISFKGGEFRIHKSNKVFENENRGIAKFRYIYYCKVRKNGNTLCRARVTIFQTIPEHVEDPQILYEGAHIGACSSLKPVKRKNKKKRKRKRKKKKTKTRMVDEDEESDFKKEEKAGMEDDSVFDNEVVESGGGSDEQFYHSNGTKNMDHNLPGPSTEQYPSYKVNNSCAIMRQPISHLPQRQPFSQPPQLRIRQQQRIEPIPSMKQSRSPTMEDEGIFTFGIDVDDFSIMNENATGDNMPSIIPFPYAGGSSWYPNGMKSSSIPNSLSNTPPFSVLGSTTPGSPTQPPPHPSSRIGEETPPTSGMLNHDYNNDGYDEIFQQQPQQQPQQQLQPQQHLQMEESNIKAVVPAEGPSIGGTLVRIFCNLELSNRNSDNNNNNRVPPRVEVTFGRKQAQVVTVLPSVTLQRENMSRSSWERANTVILVITPSSGVKEMVDIVVNQLNNNNNNNNNNRNGHRRIRAFRYYSFSQSFSSLFDEEIMDPTFDMNGYYGT